MELKIPTAPTPFIQRPTPVKLPQQQTGDRLVEPGIGQFRVEVPGPIEPGQCLIEPSLAMQRVALIGQGFRMIGIEGQDLSVADDGIFQMPLFLQGNPQVGTGIGILGLQCERLPIMGDGGIEVALFEQQIAQIGDRRDTFRIGCECLPKRGHRLFPVAHRLEGVAQMGQPLGGTGLECERPAMMVQRLGETVLFLQHDPQVGPGIAVIGPKPERLLERRDGLLGTFEFV